MTKSVIIGALSHSGYGFKLLCSKACHDADSSGKQPLAPPPQVVAHRARKTAAQGQSLLLYQTFKRRDAGDRAETLEIEAEIAAMKKAAVAPYLAPDGRKRPKEQ